MKHPRTAVIVDGARTPIGKLNGALRSLPASSLAAKAIEAALKSARVRPEDVQYTIMGQALGAGAAQNPARTAALQAGIPLNVPALTVNKVCLSGSSAVLLAQALIMAGVHDVIVAGGMESMSQAPRLLRGTRTGMPYGDAALTDHILHDGLWDQKTEQPMGALTEEANARIHGLTRREQDAFAARSHRLALRAQGLNLFTEEIVPVTMTDHRGRTTVIAEDEGIRPDTTAETLARLRPASNSTGTITAGTSSQLSDGAAAMVISSKEFAEEHGLSWIAEISGAATVAGPDTTLQEQPAAAIRHACRNAGISISDLDLAEINEAFAAVALSSMAGLNLGEDKVNVNGGAIALGHPLGMSGVRVILHLAKELQRRGGGLGAAALCGGGGQGDAVVLYSQTPDNREGGMP